MRTVIIANPSAAAGRVGADWGRICASIEQCFGACQTRFTDGPGRATIMAREALQHGAERIIAVGGDGTTNEVVNGFFDGEASVNEEATLVVFPAGTGGDFVRSVGLSGNGAIQALQQGVERRIDVGRARFTSTDGGEVMRHFVNILSMGASGEVVDRVNRMSKRLGGKLSFYLGTVRGLLAYENRIVRLRVDDLPEEQLAINTIAIANGRFFGGSMMVAPHALIDDGLFDIVIIGEMGALKFVRSSRLLYRGAHLSMPEVRILRGKRVEVTPVGPAPVLIDCDGEQPGRLAVRVELLPKKLKLLAPWQRAVAATQR